MRFPITFALFISCATASAAAGGLPPGFVYLRDVAPTIAQDIRYATPNNFTGRPLPGYAAPECVLLREVAAALARVQRDLAPRQLGLKVYDCYRPARAVAAMRRWSQSANGGGDARFYPNVPKSELFVRGFISAHSRHSAGIAVDLTLVALGTPSPAAHSRASGNEVPCTAPAAARANDNTLDMGTSFDCLDPASYTASMAVNAAQRRARTLLKMAMSQHGFRNYFREWWHYEYAGVPQHAYDFPIPKR